MSDKLIDTFIAEAGELVVDIEKALLELEHNAESKECISAIFRAMHTLKGASGMFGFQNISNITHHLESIYQDIRDDKRTLSDEVIKITFKTLDQLRNLLSSGSGATTGTDYDELLHAIKMLAGEEEQASAIPAHEGHTSAKDKTYYICFTPAQNVFRNGINPLYLVDDLLVLGHGIALPFFKDLPSLEELQLDACYMGFEVILATDKTEDEIQSAFLFIEGNCELQLKKITDEDIIKTFTSEEHPFKERDLHTPLGYDFVQKKLQKKHAKRVTEIANKAINGKSGNIRVSAERLDDLMNLVSELVTTQARLSLYSNINSSNELSAITENIEKITRRLRDNAFTMSLVPLESIAVRFQRLVSDLSKELKKEIDFKTEGLDTRIDKSIIEKLTDPILHILRNCIDHGIEDPATRIDHSKTSHGCVTLRSFYSGAHVIIEISDDGAGLNIEKIKAKAIAQNLISGDAQLTERELVDIIFLPGFSTASTVTGVSGRGVGMDVVKRNITDIRGEIEVKSTAGKGSTFIIKLPLTLSIVDGLLVKIGDIDFVLPLSAVAKCYEVETHKLESSFNHWVTLDGKRTAFMYLREAFNIHDPKPTYSQLINVPFNNTTVGLAVDKIVGEYQAVLKPLGKFYHDQDEFSGATILGDGTVALVLDTSKLIKKLAIEKPAEAFN